MLLRIVIVIILFIIYLQGTELILQRLPYIFDSFHQLLTLLTLRFQVAFLT